MDEAVRLTCPACGADRICWVAAEQSEAPCPVCGQMVTVQRVEDPPEMAADDSAAESPDQAEDAALDVDPAADDAPAEPVGEPVVLPTKLDVTLSPEPAPVYAPPPGFGYGPPMMASPYGPPPMAPMFLPQSRNVIPVVVSLGFVIAATAIFGLVQLFTPELQSQGAFSSASRASMSTAMMFLLVGVAALAVIITYFVLLLVWVYRTNQDMEAITAGTHSPSPGLAMGLLFVPAMHQFWLWHVLRRLSERASYTRQQAGSGTAIGLVPLSIFLALTILAWVAVPFNIVVTLNVQKSGNVTTEFLIFQGALLAVSLISDICLAVALWQIGQATADYTAVQAGQMGQGMVPGKMPFGKSF